MRRTISWSGICVVAMLGCTQTPHRSSESRVTPQRVDTWPDDWTPLLGQKVTLDGWASELKLGSMLDENKELSKNSIWIDGNRWPDGYYQGSGKSKHVRVTGVVIKRDDMPVVGPGGLPAGAAGVGPSRSFEETQRMKWRFLLKDATWIVLEGGKP